MKNTLILLLLLFAPTMYGQLPIPQNMQSPNASDLGKYGDTPVSLYNGTVSVSIPVYEFDEQGVPLTVSLDYDSSGVRVEDTPGWVGQNWSLSAGGIITRAVHDWPDELNNMTESVVTVNRSQGYFYPPSYLRLNDPYWATADFLVNSMTARAEPSNGKESAPDVFTFNFMGKSGKFFMGQDGEWKVASQHNLKIVVESSKFIYPPSSLTLPVSPIFQNQTKTIGEIKIQDDKGLEYVFGGATTGTPNVAIEYSKEFYEQIRWAWTATAWYLKEVRSSSGRLLYSFEYTRGPFIARFYNNTSLRSFQFNGNSCAVFNEYYGKLDGHLISPVYLSSLSSLSGEKITFNTVDSSSMMYSAASGSTLFYNIEQYCNNYDIGYNSSNQQYLNQFHHLKPYADYTQLINKLKWKKLTSITTPKGNVDFVYNSPNYTGQHTMRLGLDKVTVIDKIYSFIYDRFEQVPEITSRAVDHLGYYNGTPYPNNSFTNMNIYRIPNADKVKIGSLKKIIYPTKGTTEFEYEVNSFSQYVNNGKTAVVSAPQSNTPIGGLRIKTITTNPLSGPSQIKSYKYVTNFITQPNNQNSSGVANSLPQYEFIYRSYTMSPPGGSFNNWFTTQSSQITEWISSNNPLVPMGNLFGSPVSYSEVTELNDDGSATTFYYTNHQQFRDELSSYAYQIDVNPFTQYSDRSLLRGKLKEKRVYNSALNMIQKETYSYPDESSLATKYAKGIDLRAMISCANNGWYLNGNAYKLFYFDYSDNQLVKTEYFGNELITTTILKNRIQYPSPTSSNGDEFLKSTILHTYIGYQATENLETIYTYPFELASPIYTSMVNKRIFVPVTTEIKRSGQSQSISKIEFGNFSTSAGSLLLPSKTSFSKGGMPFTDITIIDAYDRNANVIQYHSRNGFYTTLGYGYNLKYPIIKIEGGYVSPFSGAVVTKANEIQSLLGPTLSTWSSQLPAILLKLQDVRNAYPANQVSTITYRPFIGPSTFTDAAGNIKYFEYFFGRLRATKDFDLNYRSFYEYNFKP